MGIKLPERMLDVAVKEFFRAGSLEGVVDPTDCQRLECALVAVFEWLSENPVLPTAEQYSELCSGYAKWSHRTPMMMYACAEWQRLMFLSPDQG